MFSDFYSLVDIDIFMLKLITCLFFDFDINASGIVLY